MPQAPGAPRRLRGATMMSELEYQRIYHRQKRLPAQLVGESQ